MRRPRCRFARVLIVPSGIEITENEETANAGYAVFVALFQPSSFILQPCFRILNTMQNAALSRAFEEIADYLELAGDNPFKIRAYRRAADAVLDFPDPIEDATEDELEGVEGLGAATVAKTREWTATGTIRLLEHLRRENPPGLLEVLRVPGLGPKKVKLLYQEKNIDSLEKFALALENGDLKGVSGFGPKTIENLQVSLRRLAELSERMPLTHARVTAEKIKTALREKMPDLEMHDAGSLRRGADTLGDLNFVARAENAAPIFDAFAELAIIAEVLERDETRVKARTLTGTEVELVVAPPEKFGSTLWFHTGSKAHLEAIEESGEFAEEAALYASVGAVWIAPELRQGRGEWEAARAGKLPRLVEVGDIRGDLHTHSTWSDGIASIAQMAAAIAERGHEYFAVTDHSKALAMANGLNAARLREQAREIEEVRAQFPDLLILRGVECDILRDGTLDLDDEILGELDWVIGSVHSAFNLPIEAQTARIIAAIENPNVDMIAHPTGRVLGVRAPYDVDIDALIEAAKRTGTILEINASERLDLKDEHAFAARAAGVPLCINTDAHSPKMLPNLEFGITVARRAWCEAKDVFNCQTKDEIKKLVRGAPMRILVFVSLFVLVWSAPLACGNSALFFAPIQRVARDRYCDRLRGRRNRREVARLGSLEG